MSKSKFQLKDPYNRNLKRRRLPATESGRRAVFDDMYKEAQGKVDELLASGGWKEAVVQDVPGAKLDAEPHPAP